MKAFAGGGMGSLGKVRFVVSLVVSLAITAGCASKPVDETPLVGPPVPKAVESVPLPTDVPATLPREDSPTRPLEKRKITLVLGGAGVASFATVGLLKRLREENIDVESVVATGWPALFAVGYGFTRSIHDLEWFAMRVQEKDLFRSSFWDLRRQEANQEQLQEFLAKAFGQRDLEESTVPLVIAVTNTETAQPVAYDRGEWREPVLKTMAVPGIFRPYPQEGGREYIASLRGLDVDEALRRGAQIVVAVEMYDDYLKELGKDLNRGQMGGEKTFRQLYLTQLRTSLKRELELANGSGSGRLGKPPIDLQAKRAAIQAGYNEGKRLARLIKALPR
jgi:NTE family protein